MPETDCEFCANPERFGLLPAVEMEIELWGRFGAVLINELNGQPILDPQTQKPMRAWGARTDQVFMHPNIHQMSCGPKGICCKRSVN